MKKTILILFMAIMAAGLNTTYGQDCPTPRAVDTTCLGADALHPVAGIPYTYTVSVPSPPGNKTYWWMVTQSQTFITNGTVTATVETAPGPIILATGPGYNDPVLGDSAVVITWNSFAYNPAQPVFVVIYVTNEASTPDGCVTNNMKVYKIEPQIAFTLDIANVTKLGVTANYEDTIARCLHDIVSATYNAGVPEGILYDFGADTLYYVVTAANYDTSWLPAIQLAGLDPDETITNVEWDTSFVFNNPTSMIFSSGTYTSPIPVPVRNSSNAVGPEGECIWIRVAIDHSESGLTYEGLTDETITLAIDGTTNLSNAPVGDIHYSSTEPVPNVLCGKEDGFQFDLAVQILKPRPNVQNITPGGGFLPVQP